MDEIIKISAEINEIETKRTIQRTNETNNEKINKIGKSLAKPTKSRGRRQKLLNLEMKKEPFQQM
jgi:hypothetical protein